MSDGPNDDPPAGPAPLARPAAAARVAVVGAVLAAVVATFAYLGGWLTPAAVTPAKFADAFEAVDGLHPGFRRNHAKGLCVTGHFDATGQATRLSAAAVFRPGRVPVIGRFSFAGGQPYAADSDAAIRGLGLQFTQPDGQLWRTGMIDLPVFPVRTPGQFYDRMLTGVPDPATGKPDPAKLAAFNAAHPELQKPLQLLKAYRKPSAFDNTTFHSLNAFRFTNDQGTSTPVRWLMVPVTPFAPATTGPAASDDKNFLFDGLIARVERDPPQWHLMLIVGQPGDPTDDATTPWPADREQVDAGTLTIDHVESDETSPTRDVNFDPLVLPAGMAASDDPLLSARSAVYARSFTRREGEPKSAPAVTPADVAHGG
jgi:catalase